MIEKYQKAWSFLKFLFGLVLILFLIWSCNIQSVLHELQSIHITIIIPVILIYFTTLLLLSLRWRYILLKMGYNVPVKIIFPAFCSGILLSDISPGRIGDISRPYYIKEIVPAGPGLASYILDRYVDFIGKIILCVLAIFLLASLFSSEMFLIFFLIAILPVMLLSFFWINSEKGLMIFNHPKILKFYSFCCDIREGIKRLTTPLKVITISTIWTLFASLLQGLRLVLLAWGLGYSLPLVEITILQSLVSSLSLIPLTISGLGIVEGGLTAVFSSFGIPAAVGVSIAILDRVITVMVHIGCGIWYIIRK